MNRLLSSTIQFFALAVIISQFVGASVGNLEVKDLDVSGLVRVVKKAQGNSICSTLEEAVRGNLASAKNPSAALSRDELFTELSQLLGSKPELAERTKLVIKAIGKCLSKETGPVRNVIATPERDPIKPVGADKFAEDAAEEFKNIKKRTKDHGQDIYDKTEAIEEAEDVISFDRVQIAELSRIARDSRKLSLEKRCDALDDGLRKMLKDYPVATKSHSALLSAVSRSLSQRQLPFGNDMPYLVAINKCQEASAGHSKALEGSEDHDAEHEFRDDLPGHPDDLPESQHDLPEGPEHRFVDREGHDDNYELTRKPESKIDKMAGNVEKQSMEKVLPGGNEEKDQCENDCSAKQTGEREFGGWNAKVREKIGEFIEEEERDREIEESDPVRKLELTLEDERRMTEKLRKILQEDEVQMVDLRKRIAELEKGLAKGTSSLSTKVDTYRTRFEVMKQQYEQASAREAKIKELLDSVQKKFVDLEIMVKNGIGKDCDNKKKVLKKPTEVVRKLAKELRDGENQASKCYKHFLALTYRGKVTKTVVKTIAKLHLTGGGSLDHISVEEQQELQRHIDALVESGDEKAAQIGRELSHCLPRSASEHVSSTKSKNIFQFQPRVSATRGHGPQEFGVSSEVSSDFGNQARGFFESSSNKASSFAYFSPRQSAPPRFHRAPVIPPFETDYDHLKHYQ